MKIKYIDVYLRDLIKEDVDTYIRWNTVETEWMKWDAPWEKAVTDPVKIRARFMERLAKPKTELRRRLNICYKDGSLIGTVNCYYIDINKERLAVGIDIRESSYWGKGLGKQALQLWLAYLFNVTEEASLFTETWSGNFRMIGLARSVGFYELVDERKLNYRLVNGEPVHGLTFKLDRNKFISDNSCLMDITAQQLRGIFSQI